MIRRKKLTDVILHRGSRGRKVKQLQHGANRILGNRNFKWRKVKEDGKLGKLSMDAVQMAAWLTGLSRKQLRRIHRGQVTRWTFQILTHQRRRPWYVKRAAKKRARHADRLRRLHRKKLDKSVAGGVGTFDGKPVAAWIVPWLEKSRANGWHGTLVSGWRDPVYSEGLCYAMCGAPSCRGRCAGRASNHSGSSYPAGAIDVSDYYTFAVVQRRIGSPLINRLGSADPVHFSISGY